MLLSRLKYLGLLVFAVSGLASLANAQIVTVPTALSPGAQYRLAFLTAGTITATSTSIATYNTFVTSQANTVPALQNMTWTAIATTDAVNAITNIGAQTGVPVYNLAGQLVVSTTALLFNGAATAYSNPINITQTGGMFALATPIWTGTWDGGIKQPTDPNSALGDSNPHFGRSGSTTYVAYNNGGFYDPTLPLPIYAISGVLTVPTPTVPGTPAPPSIWLIAIGLGAIGVFYGYRNRRASLN